MIEFYSHPSGVLYCGDALTVLRDLPCASADLCVTSPPYYNPKRPDRYPDVLGLEPHLNAYLVKLGRIFVEVRRLMKPDGAMWLVVDALGAGAMSQACLWGGYGWYLHRQMSCRDGIIQVFTVQPRYREDLFRLKAWDYKLAKPGIPISEPGTGKLGHFPPFSRDIPRQAIKHCCPIGGTILDPFTGQGTTIFEAIKTKRKFVGVEISLELCEHIKKELAGDSPCP